MTIQKLINQLQDLNTPDRKICVYTEHGYPIEIISIITDVDERNKEDVVCLV